MRITEIFNSIQGEGIETGMPCTFIRLAGCNLACEFCDTNFAHSNEMTIDQILSQVARHFVVITGGEPLLQYQGVLELATRLFGQGFLVGVETNGTLEIYQDLFRVLYSISMSPKQPCNETKLTRCDSLKILYPFLPDVTVESFEYYPFTQGFLQPIDGVKNSVALTVEEVHYLNTPRWKLGVQLHKLLRVQ